MARKTYRTFRLKGLQVFINDAKGNRMEIVFRSGIQIDSTAKFTTSDEYVQEKLEALNIYGKSFYLESCEEIKKDNVPTEEVSEPTAPENTEEVADIKDIRRFRNLVEMKSAMEELGLEVTADMNYQKAKAVAKKAGYDFQIQK